MRKLEDYYDGVIVNFKNLKNTLNAENINNTKSTKSIYFTIFSANYTI